MWALPLRMGWSVIPLHPRDKRPALASWRAYQRSKASRADLVRWAAAGSYVGIVTGQISGLLILDLDSADAVTEAERLGLPETVTARTAKGRHCYFSHPGGSAGNRAGLLPGMDIRGDGGFVVAPGSIHPTGVRYTWIASPETTPLSDIPGWLSEALAEKPHPIPSNLAQESRLTRFQPLEGECTAYGRAALERESAAILRAISGRQECTLNGAALKIGALVAGGEIAPAVARRELVRAGMGMPNHDGRNVWTLEAVVSKIDRGLSDGAASPRRAPPTGGLQHG